MATKPTIHISDQTYHFLKSHFSAVRKGTMYILECFPMLFESALEENGLTGKQLQDLRGRIASLDIRPSPTGNLLPQLAPPKLKAKVQAMSQFQRAMVELLGCQDNPNFRHLPPLASTRAVGLELSEEAREFIESLFPSFGPGAAFLLDQFPGWCADALRGVPEEIKQTAMALMLPIKSQGPLLAGRLLRRRQETLSPSDKGHLEIPKEMPTFTVFALEVLGMSGEKKVVRASPKCFPSTFDELANIFGSDNAGVTQAITMFPHVFRTVVGQEILERFSEEEMDLLGRLLQESGGANPYLPGETILEAIQRPRVEIYPDQAKELEDKVKRVSFFGRACLEVLLEKDQN